MLRYAATDRQRLKHRVELTIVITGNAQLRSLNRAFRQVFATQFLPDGSPELIEAFRSAIPLGRLGAPEDIAAAVSYLASPVAGYVTGCVLHVNGGMYMA